MVVGAQSPCRVQFTRLSDRGPAAADSCCSVTYFCALACCLLTGSRAYRLRSLSRAILGVVWTLRHAASCRCARRSSRDRGRAAMGGGPSRPRRRPVHVSGVSLSSSDAGSASDAGSCSSSSYWSEECSSADARATSRLTCSQCGECCCSDASSAAAPAARPATDKRLEMLRLCLRHEIEQLNFRQAARRSDPPRAQRPCRLR